MAWERRSQAASLFENWADTYCRHTTGRRMHPVGIMWYFPVLSTKTTVDEAVLSNVPRVFPTDPLC
jgi:hypothetical protein